MPATSKGKPDSRYLQRVGGRWYCRVPVPSAWRRALGPYRRRTLETADLAEARRRRWDMLPVLKAEIEAEAKRRGLTGLSPQSPQERSYAAFRAALAAAGPVNIGTDDEPIENPAVEDALYRAEVTGEAENPEFVRAYRDYAKDLPTVSAILTHYLKANPKRSRTTEANYATTVRLWIRHRGDSPLQGLRRNEALAWLNIVSKGKAKDTLSRYVANMATLWEWAHRANDERPRNPFERLTEAADDRGRDTDSYGVFDDEELRRAYDAVRDDGELRPAFLIAVYAGFRLSECISAERVTVDGLPCLSVTEGKTRNAARAIPEHPRLAGVSVPEGAKASALTVRFGRKMRRAGLPGGKTFHSLRKSFTTALERAGCPDAVMDRLLGHRPATLARNVYSGGLRPSDMRSWVEGVAYPSLEADSRP